MFSFFLQVEEYNLALQLLSENNLVNWRELWIIPSKLMVVSYGVKDACKS